MKEDVNWKGMARCAKKYVMNCRDCLQGKSHTGKRNGLCQAQVKPNEKMHTWHIDHAGPLVASHGKTQILVIIDSFSKYVKFCSLNKKKTSEDSIKALKEVFKDLGKPKRIIADRGLAFQSATFKQFLQESGIELHLVATGIPRGNGQVERVMRTMFNMMRATLNQRDEKQWVNELPKIEDDYNALVNKTTGVTPYELMFGEKTRLKAVQDMLKEVPKRDTINVEQEKTVNKRLEDMRQDIIRRMNKNRKTRSFQVGDQVLIEESQIGGGKLKARYKGPFEILTCLPNDRYALKKINGQKRITVAGQEQLRQWPHAKAQTDALMK